MDGKLIPQKIELNSPQNAIYCLSITRVISYYYLNAPSLCDDCLNIIRYFSRFRIFHAAVTRLIKLLGSWDFGFVALPAIQIRSNEIGIPFRERSHAITILFP